MKRRSGKYLNAREYAERLRLSDNKDVQDFAEDFLDALDAEEDLEAVISAMETKIEEFTEECNDEEYLKQIEWLGKGSDMALRIEKLIEEKCPEYAEWTDVDSMVGDLISRLQRLSSQPTKLEYDL